MPELPPPSLEELKQALASGRRTFPGLDLADADVLRRAMSGKFRGHDEMQRIIDRSLKKSPNARYNSGSEMLKDLGLYEKVTGYAKCKSCWAVEGKTWFSSRHHRETPLRIENGEADVGIVWATEVAYAKSQGRGVEGVPIKAPYNMQDKVGYAIGALTDGRNPEAAQRFLKYLATDKAQSIYEKYGFVRATNEELKLRAL